MGTVRERLEANDILGRVALDGAALNLVSSAQISTSMPRPDGEEGTVNFGAVGSLFSFFDFDLKLPGPGRKFVLTFEGPPGDPTAFRLAISLNEGPASPLFDAIARLPGHALVGASVAADGRLKPNVDPRVELRGGDVALVLKGKAGETASLELSTSMEPPDDIVVLELAPEHVLLGASGFGLSLPGGIALDMSAEAVAPGQTRIGGTAVTTPADAASWRGLVARQARLWLPPNVPFLEDLSTEAYVAIGMSPAAGAEVVVNATLPATVDRPEVTLRIECRDPEARGLASFVPTLVEAVVNLPIDGRAEAFSGETVTFAAGDPVRLRARWSRRQSLADSVSSTELSLAVEGQGAAGIMSVSSSSGEVGAKTVVTAAALVTALIAEHGLGNDPAPGGDGSGVLLDKLLGAAILLSGFLESGGLVVHGVELASYDDGSLPPKALKLKLDYSVSAKVKTMEFGALKVEMKEQQPLRVRVREVLLSFFPEESGLRKFHLDYGVSSIEVEDPGGWEVTGPASLFDVLGTRSGRGSMWIEVDLGFKLDLGPVRVSGATIRATLDDEGHLNASLRGLAASIDLPPAIDGEGAGQITEGGFYARLAAHIQPLGVGAVAMVEKEEARVSVGLGVDLPGPIPLGATGLGLYGIGGVFSINGVPALSAGDLVKAQLNWTWQDDPAFKTEVGSATFGLEAVLGTAPDLGFSFSARSGLFLSLPDVAVRGAVTCKFLSPRATIEHAPPDPAGFNAEGVVVVDPKDGVLIAIEGRYQIPRILEVTAPVAARFPVATPDWFVHIGADGWRPPPGGKDEGRAMGPLRATILPDFFPQKADAYLMMRGSGITDWPRGGGNGFAPRTIASGFVVAFGFGFDLSMGVRPILWAQVFARADILLAVQPLSFVGMGKVGGRLHVAVFSVGVEASLHLYAVEDQPIALTAQVCGEIDLFFDTVRKCVSIGSGPAPTWTVPEPSASPLDRGEGQALVDDRYNVVGRLAASREAADDPKSTAWADAILQLSFASAPALALSSTQFPNIGNDPWGPRACPLGNDLLEYTWQLTALSLVDDTDTANPTFVPGSMSSAWLKPKAGKGGGQPQPAELALLTPDPGLWLTAFADGGASLPDKPLEDVAQLCRIRPQATAGWAIGALASREGEGWRMPSDPVSPDPCDSQFSVLALARFGSDGFDGPVLDENSGQQLPLPHGYAPGVVQPITPQRLDLRDFAGLLWPGCAVHVPDASVALWNRLGLRNVLELACSAPLRDARLWLVVDRAGWDSNAIAGLIAVNDNLGRTWSFTDEEPFGSAHVALLFVAPTGGWVDRVIVQSSVGRRMGVIAVRGTTAAADAAANAALTAATAVATGLATAAASPPPGGGQAQSNQRCVLEPGRVYRVDVDLAWEGRIYQRNDANVRELKGQNQGVVNRQYWFRTAPQGLPPAEAEPNTKLAFEFLHTKRHIFDPAMLVRHLRGYEPAQSELCRFADDPVRVHFGVGHVSALAKAYGFDLTCAVRRLDVPEAEEPDQFIIPALLHPTDTQFMETADKAIAEAYFTSPCRRPVPGLVMEAKPTLATRAWYEVHVLADAISPGVADGRIDGVSFQTSRWRNASELLAAHNFPEGVQGRHSGDIWLSHDAIVPQGSILADDMAFDAALEDLCLEGWPTATEPRVSLLWSGRAIQGWRCAGIILESPEPIHRPGRLLVTGMQVRSGPARRPLQLEMVRRDRAGARIIFAGATPFVPKLTGAAGMLRADRHPLALLSCDDFAGGGAVATARVGRLRLPLAPAFAGDAG